MMCKDIGLLTSERNSLKDANPFQSATPHPPVFASLKFPSSIKFPEIPRLRFPLSKSGEFLRLQIIEEELLVKIFNYFLSGDP